MKEIKDIAQWEETDSELAKYKIQALNSLVNSYKKQNEFLEASIKHIEQVNKKLYERIDNAIELLDSYKLGKYDYALSPAGLLELEDILKGEDIKEIPQFEGTLEQLDKLSIKGKR